MVQVAVCGTGRSLWYRSQFVVQALLHSNSLVMSANKSPSVDMLFLIKQMVMRGFISNACANILYLVLFFFPHIERMCARLVPTQSIKSWYALYMLAPTSQLRLTS